MKIVILDGHVANPGDIDWSPISDIAHCTIYPRTSDDEFLDRAIDAEIIIVNKFKLTKERLLQLDKLQCICLLSTGFNSVDIEVATDRKIVVCNAVGYGSQSVAQHVFALILELTNRVGLHNDLVQHDAWADSADWSFTNTPMMELNRKTIGIYGYGKIGSAVAKIALGFGMNVIANRRDNSKGADEGVTLVDFAQLLKQSDILSLHAPLTEENHGIINESNLSQMKDSALLINTGRGGLVNEADLKFALENGVIRGAALDVLSVEPPPSNHILIGLKNCIITPHHAWTSTTARTRLIKIVSENIKAFLKAKPQNVVNSFS